MAVKIRLQRHGKKNNVFFHLVVADSRAPRDGAFIEKLGIYNPNTNPATVDINFESTLKWLQDGAIPTNTCNAILSYKGILMKKHLLDGVTKGALTVEQVETKFAAWMQEKEAKVNAKKDNLSTGKKSDEAKRVAIEKAAKEVKAAKVAAKVAPPVVEAAAAPEAPTEEAAPATEA
ncbi:MAG: 30S ribosomal protein S16 [Bacteroidia bacterium]